MEDVMEWEVTEQDVVEREVMELGVMDRARVDQVEFRSRGQSNKEYWFKWRRNRITASVAHYIARSRFANGRSRAPPASYLALITGEGPGVKTRAMTWGIDNEARAIRQYKLETAMLGRKVWVQKCGLFIDPQNPWLGASPDGIVMNRRRGQRLRVLEVYCPYKHRHSSVADACRVNRDFCLEIQKGSGRPVYRLKPKHRYFTQVQVQMAVTGLPQADFVVFTLKETVIVQVDFDAEWWEETLPKLDRFYREAVLQKGLRPKMQDP
ncbi:uncharacterized protein LOC133442155 [Cololabis saira]|uniref:uncharacterized protein LOC133442155 n=1 Tax=Cololabis saira TaxID=129043 RepID=UPI002AD4BEE4|nr:uncharacterized protein LOC133442155 [Cololabis saira]